MSRENLEDAKGDASSEPQPAPEAAGDDLPALAAIYESAAWGIAIASADGTTLLRANPSFGRMHGRDHRSLAGVPLAEIFDPSWRHELSRHVAKAVERGRHGFVSWNLRPGAEPFPASVDALAVPGVAGRPARVVLHVEDVSQRSELEELLANVREEHETIRAELETFIEEAPEGIFVADLQGRFVDANRAACTLVGREASEIIGRTIVELVIPEDADRVWQARAALLDGRTETSEWRLLHKDGSIVPVEVCNKVLADGRWQAFARAMGGRARAQEAMSRQAQRLQEANLELEAFSHAVSHDLRGPLRTLCGFSEILLSELGESVPEGDRDLLLRMQQSAARLSGLVEALYGLSRIAGVRLQRTAVDLASLARRAIDELRARDPTREIDVVMPPHLVAEGDPALLGGVIDNLLENAWKYTRDRDHPRIEIGATEREGERCFFVSDNGSGFDPSRAADIFVPFTRAHEASAVEGSGIGLATVERVIRRHGGRVWAEGRPGTGATFLFTL